jgi:hypothetical protein
MAMACRHSGAGATGSNEATAVFRTLPPRIVERADDVID